MRVTCTFLCSILLAYSCFAQDKDSLVSWIRGCSINLQSSSHDTDTHNFPSEFFNGISVVLAGEASHGTSEFAQIKHRLFRLLVEEYNFKYFLVEADFAASLAIDRYICHNSGDPKLLLADLGFFHIANQDGLNLVKWMNQFNADKKDEDKIRFLGIDCQRSDKALELLKEYFQANNYNFYNQIKGYQLKASTLKFGAHTLGEDSIRIIRNELTKNKNIYIRKTSRAQTDLMFKLTEILEQSFLINNSDGEGYILREQYTAELAKWILNKDNNSFQSNTAINKKGFVWAHNAHVNYTTITNRGSGKTRLSLGGAIRETFKDEVYSIGMDFNKGEFYANEFQRDGTVKGKIFTVGDAPDDTFSYLLSETKYPVLFLDLRDISNPALKDYLGTKKVKYRNVTAVFDDAYPLDMRFRSHIMPQRFDGLIFIHKSTPVKLLKNN